MTTATATASLPGNLTLILLAVAVSVLTALLLVNAWRRPAIRVPAGVAVLVGVAGGALIALVSRQDDIAQIPLPPIQLETLDGEHVILSELNDQPLVINLWATWCLPCRREMPLLEAAQAREHNIRFVFINQGESLEQIRDYLGDEALALNNVLMDSASVATRLFQTRGLPATYFFDADGTMVDAHVGELTATTLNRRLRQLR